MGNIQITVLNPNWGDILAREINEAGVETRKEASRIGKRLFERWMATWARKYPVKVSERGKYSTWITISNKGTGKDREGNDKRTARDFVPAYLDDGTDKRLAVMTPIFGAKTAVGLVNSGPGVGGFVRLSGSEGERPGIEPRNISLTVEKQLDKDVQEELRRRLPT